MSNRLYIVIFFLWVGLGYAQNDTIVLPEDQNSVLTERKLSDDLNQKYAGEEFDYDVKTGESANLLSRAIRWFLNLVSNTFGFDISPRTLLILEYIIYALMGALVIYLLVRMFVNEQFNALFTKKAKSIIDIDLSEQHIESIDLDALMNDALKNKDYRLAVRYQFLKLLKLLSQQNLIAWHFDKTNSDYQREIKEGQLQQEFKKATYLYENIWYGEQPLDESGYQKTDERFNKLKNLITR